MERLFRMFYTTDMRKNTLRVTFFLGLAGTLFAGYLSAVKLFSSVCAFNSPCPYFLGAPACWYGLAMFFLIALVSLLGWTGAMRDAAANAGVLAVSALGTLFAVSFVVPEIRSGQIVGGSLGLSTCSYALVFFAIVLALSVRASRSRNG